MAQAVSVCERASDDGGPASFDLHLAAIRHDHRSLRQDAPLDRARSLKGHDRSLRRAAGPPPADTNTAALLLLVKRHAAPATRDGDGEPTAGAQADSARTAVGARMQSCLCRSPRLFRRPSMVHREDAGRRQLSSHPKLRDGRPGRSAVSLHELHADRKGPAKVRGGER